jgi:hypothetical protein
LSIHIVGKERFPKNYRREGANVLKDSGVALQINI